MCSSWKNHLKIYEFSIVKCEGLKYMNFLKGIKLDFICMKLMKNKKYLQQKFSRKVVVPKTPADFTLRISKSYVPFTCKFPMVMHFVLILHKRCRSKTNFYVFNKDKTSLKFYSGFWFFLAVFIEKFQKICYLNYVKKEYLTKYAIHIHTALDRSLLFGKQLFSWSPPFGLFLSWNVRCHALFFWWSPMRHSLSVTSELFR